MKRRHFLATAALPLAACDTPRTIDGSFIGVNDVRGHLLRDNAPMPQPSATRRTRVLIAGGGVAGLAAARALRLRGIDDFAVLELEDIAGGNARGGALNGIACPLGAHYLPVPGDHAPDVQNLLEEFGLRQRIAGRWTYDERHLCHSPQERLFIDGQWQDGLLPVQGVDAATLADYRRFAQQVAAVSKAAPFQMPVRHTTPSPTHLALDAMTFDTWLQQQGLAGAGLRWYLDYCCRDDYGAGLANVSAWAGLHYFASRHGFQAPGETPAEDDHDGGVLTWPEGNGWLTKRLAAPLGYRLKTGRVVTRIAAGKHGVEVDAYNTQTQSVERWSADACIVALPLFIAARVVDNAPPALKAAAAALRYAPWLVANLHIDAALHDRPGAAPSWDNVIYDAGDGLGYVDAMHQSLQSVPAATVLTYYRALGLRPDARKNLLTQPWSHWRDTVLAELSVPHPDLRAKVTRIDVMRYGHAMSSPVPGIHGNTALRALQAPLPAPWQRLQFAHSDLSGYSVFEEAFTHGHQRGTSLFSSSFNASFRG